MKNYDLEEILDTLSDEEINDLVEDLVFQLQTLLIHAGSTHILDGNLTSLPASVLDTLH